MSIDEESKRGRGDEREKEDEMRDALIHLPPMADRELRLEYQR